MMKNIFFTFLVALSLSSFGQATLADPAVGFPSLRSVNTGDDVGTSTLSNQPVVLRVPVRNLSPLTALPPSSTQITIGLGNNLQLENPSTVASSLLNEYYTWTSSTIAGQVQIVGVQKNVSVPAFFFGNAEFRVVGNTVGSSTITATIDPISAGLDDINPNNNSSSLNYTVTSLSVMPVKLSQFAVARNGCSIDVSYLAEEQINVNRFEVQASKNGTDFFSLGSIAAGYTTKYNGKYQITDAIKSSNLYVRLQTIDNDGKSSLSEVVRVSGICDGGRSLVLSVYPNPIRSGRTLTINSKDGSFNGKYSVSLLDLTGRTLQAREMQLNNVSNFKFDVGNLSSGQYLIRVLNTELSESSVISFQKN